MQVAKADLGTISQGQERSQTKQETGTGAVERKETWRLGGSPRVERRRSSVLLSALPLAGPAHPGPGIRANGRDPVGRGLRTGAAPARPFRRLCRRACGSAEGRACALSAFFPTSGCRRHRSLQSGTPCDR